MVAASVIFRNLALIALTAWVFYLTRHPATFLILLFLATVRECPDCEDEEDS